MRFQEFQNGLETAPQLLRQFLWLQPLGGNPASSSPIPFHSLKRVAFFIEHPLNLQNDLNITPDVQSLVSTTFLGFRKGNCDSQNRRTYAGSFVTWLTSPIL